MLDKQLLLKIDTFKHSMFQLCQTSKSLLPEKGQTSSTKNLHTMK
uniref:Uncharacterized protein n=1 Tax=Arundo donax TaxID=35708 RepID=A0A0A9F545_ARUDO